MMKSLSFSSSVFMFFSFLVFFLLVLLKPITIYATLTPAGTIITNGGDKGTITVADVPGDVILIYKSQFIQAATTTQEIATTTILQGYGLAPFDKLQDKLLGGSRTVYYTYTITNKGNGTDTIKFSLSIIGSNWQVNLIEDTNQDGIHQATETATFDSITLPQEQSRYFFLEVIVPESNEGDNVTAKITANCAGTDTWGMPDTQIATVSTGFDITPPKIYHTPITKIGMLGNKIIIKGTITDGTIVDKALLHYGTETIAITGTMTMDFDSIYSYTIPPDLVGTAGITYQIYSTDGLNATSTLEYQIEISQTTLGTIPEQGGTITVQDGNPDDGETTIIIPKDALPEEGTVSITQKAIEDTPDPSGNFLIQSDKPAAFYEFKTPKKEFTQKVTITMLYLDVDNDGYEDITGEDESTLRVFYWNDTNQKWELIDGIRDQIKNTITVEVTHLSQFAIFPSKKPAAKRLSKVFVYPNPCYSNRHYQLTFAGLTENVTIKIFNIAGELVRTLEKKDIGQEKNWDLRNDAYENVASGIYIYLVIDNDTGEKVTGKLGVIR
ncbi:MAG: T9SS type A sorting domain-containing protein [bacterium]